MDTLVLNKAGPRLIDFYRDDNRLTIAVNGPGMLFEKLELMINKTALDGAGIDFFRRVAAGLRATIACPHEPMRSADITVDIHRLGAELSIELGPASMYQSQLSIYTAGGESFRQLIDASLDEADTRFVSKEPLMAMLVAVRATSHHEHHASAASEIRKNKESDSAHHHSHMGHEQGESS